MQRYFVAKEQMTDHNVQLVGEDVKHIVKVMRMDLGDKIVCSDNDARTVICTISSYSDKEVIAEIIEELHPETELPVKVTIAQGLPKGDKLDYIIQKGTELGATAFLPFSASRSIVKWDEKKADKKIERLEKIAKEAAEQSYRERIPVISNVFSFQKLLQQLSAYDVVIVAYEESAKAGEKAQLAQVLSKALPGQNILIVIGPEGGITEDEVASLTEHGAILCGFGPRILRTETAALYALAAISYHFELMR
ncbi:ribosomal RNA small subunit methyltransferase E [Halalkalibacter wakoensis JCM 9140]|uniref:Ribosomal RNA small subunit methyltransferase E n=1 Tax=Halalkalibacter wakoensis JCM 9140 TaxID=1236970 RepID=W4Q5J3_9BACI|nr:16S rRNA (uracil(1498)-N(3))-methyltransferase [Halalkalibacter wakoensis]GAE26953.1 ribosomal RNA small subunit methyltransferase E [Halalkalibacter wakoensis JCM 9140]